jgi:hypothetical protein
MERSPRIVKFVPRRQREALDTLHALRAFLDSAAGDADEVHVFFNRDLAEFTRVLARATGRGEVETSNTLADVASAVDEGLVGLNKARLWLMSLSESDGAGEEV